MEKLNVVKKQNGPPLDVNLNYLTVKYNQFQFEKHCKTVKKKFIKQEVEFSKLNILD